MRADPIQVSPSTWGLIGGDVDFETWEITYRPRSSYWMEEANDAGHTRPERLEGP